MEDKIQKQIENLHKKLGGSPPQKKVDNSKNVQQPWISQEQADVLKMIKDFPKYGNPNANLQLPNQQQQNIQFLPSSDIQFYQNLYKPKHEKLNDQKIIALGIPTTSKTDQMQNKINQLRDKIFNDQNTVQPEQHAISHPFAQQNQAILADSHIAKQQINNQNVLVSKIQTNQQNAGHTGGQQIQHQHINDPNFFSSNINQTSAFSVDHLEQHEQPTDIVSLANHGGDQENLLQELEKLQKLIKSQENVILDLNNQQVKMQIEIQDKSDENSRLKEQINELQGIIDKQGNAGDNMISSLRRSQDVEHLKKENDLLKEQLGNIMQTYEAIENDIEKTQGIVQENQILQQQLQNKDDSIHELKQQLEEKENIIKQNEEKLAKSGNLQLSQTNVAQNSETNKQIEEYQIEIQKLQQSIINHTQLSEKLNSTIEQQNVQIQQMQEQITSLTQNIEKYQNQMQEISQQPHDQNVFLEKIDIMQEIIEFFKQQVHAFQPKKIKLNISDSPSLQKLRQRNRFEKQLQQSE